MPMYTHTYIYIYIYIYIYYLTRVTPDPAGRRPAVGRRLRRGLHDNDNNNIYIYIYIYIYRERERFVYLTHYYRY